MLNINNNKTNIKYPIKICIVIPGYNCEKYIKRCFESILNQTFKPNQIIFINDGSNDNTLNMANDYRLFFNHAKINYIIINNKKNIGQAASISKALPYVSSDYFTWLDIDDYLKKEYCKQMISFMEKNKNIDICLCDCETFDNNNSIIEKANDDKDYFECIINNDGVLWAPGSTLTRTKYLFKRIPDKKIYNSREGQNYQLLLPLFYKAKYKIIHQPLYVHTINDNSHSSSKRSTEEVVNRYISICEIIENTLTGIPNMSKNEKLHYSKKAKTKIYRKCVDIIRSEKPTNLFLLKKILKLLKKEDKLTKKEILLLLICSKPFGKLKYKIVFGK